jgi:hypothetical protein
MKGVPARLLLTVPLFCRYVYACSFFAQSILVLVSQVLVFVCSCMRFTL